MVGGKVCSVASCRNVWYKNKASTSTADKAPIMYFSFPKDEKIRKEWVIRCYRGDKFSPQHKRICSKHFLPEDYEDEMKARLTGTYPKKLKKTAIPSLYLRSQDEIEIVITEREKRAQRKDRKRIVEEILEVSDNIRGTSTDTSVVLPPTELLENKDRDLRKRKDRKRIVEDILEVSDNIPEISTDTLLVLLPTEVLEEKDRDLRNLKSELELARKEIVNLKAQIEQQKNKELKMKKQLSSYATNFEERVKNELKEVLTSNQFDIILKKRTRARTYKRSAASAGISESDRKLAKKMLNIVN